jgi:hypothetical protein
MESQGKTGTLLSVKLASSIIEAGWREAFVAGNGTATAQVLTQYVADGASIKLTLTDGDGKTQGTLSGKIVANTFRVKVPVPKGTKEFLTFQAELSAHGLTRISHRIKVGPLVAIEKPQWLDADKKQITELEEQVKVVLQAKVSGIPDKTPCSCRVLSTRLPKDLAPAHTMEGFVKDGKISFPWKIEFLGDHESWPTANTQKKFDDKYEHASFQAEFTCMGTRVLSDVIKYPSWIEFDVEGFKGTIKFQLPEGRVEEVKTDGTNPIRIKKPGVGQIEILERTPDPS